MVLHRRPPLLTMSSLSPQCVIVLSLVSLFAERSVAAPDVCTFEKGICPQWVSSNCNQDACFQARKVASMLLGPAYDHTSKSADGWSAYATTTPASWFRHAELTRRVKGPFCFTGWYHLSGTQITTADFLVRVVKTGMLKFFHSSQPDMMGRWQRVRYSENKTGDFEIIIRYYVVTPAERGAFAVDDLSVDDKACAEPADGSCDFDWGDRCGYDLGDNRSGKWVLEGQKRVNFFGPDYSTNTRSGGLLFLELKGNQTSAVLTSPKLSGRGGTQCLEFRYRLPHGFWDRTTTYLLGVMLEGSRKARWTWSTSDLRKGSWGTAEVSFKEDQDFKLKFQCVMRGRGVSGSFCALDAIKLRDCQGKRAMNDSLCDFEDGWCSWQSEPSSSSRMPWMLGGGNAKTTLARPANDHTYGNATGSYAFFSNYERKIGDKGDLVSEILRFSSSITQCAEFWYIISGDKRTELKVLTREPNRIALNHVPLWTQKSSSSSEWHMGRVAVPHRKQVVFRAAVGPALTPAFIALDDIAIVHHDRCETFPKGSEVLSPTELLSCDFSDWNFCKWSSMSSSVPKWTFMVDRFSSLGPLSYPTKGSIAYVTGSNLASVRGTVAIHSAFVGPQSQLACFTFWYHMFGGRGAWLNLNLQKSTDTDVAKKTMVLFYHRDRTTADRWYNVRRTVSFEGVHNKMILTITNASSLPKDSVVALGPFQLTMGECDVLTDGQGYCDFEFNTCGWTAAAAWRRRIIIAYYAGPAASSGPINSVYALTATSRNAPPDGALFTSPEWSGQSQPQCLEFWYKYGGTNDPTLQVEVKSRENSQVVWQQPLYPGDDWMLARVQISQDKTFQVIFRAKFTGDTTQYISIDDVILRPEPCVHPAECNFNDGICGYVNQLQRNFRWLVGTGRYERPRLQPAVPRAKDTPPFAYLDLTTSVSDAAGPVVNKMQGLPNTVGLRSPLFDVTNNNTQLAIRYYRRGSDIIMANLSVSCYRNASEAKPEVQFNIGMKEVSQWTTLNATINRGTACQLAVIVTRGPGTNGTMAISSVKVTSSKPVSEPKQTKDSPTRCTFEDGTMCGWNPGRLSNKWSLNDPAKKLPAFPRFDHTIKAYRGRFVYATHDIDYDWGTAVFKSPDLDVNATHGACLSFWLLAVHSSHVNLAVWSGIDRLYITTARSSHRWEHVLVNFKRPEGKFQLFLSFFMKQALVALDDIEITSGYCGQRDFCSWEIGSPCPVIHGPGRFATWTVRNGSEIGLPDHTLKNVTGRYLYLNTTAVDSHHPISRVFMWMRPPTEAMCVTFWFTGRGGLGRLNVYRFTKETILRDPLVSVATPVNDGLWIARRVSISSRNMWSLVFEGVATPGVRTESAIMVDDVEFTEGECPPYEYCTFEDECLPWIVRGNAKGAAFEVERAGSFDKLPRDHTTQTEDGYYLLFKSPGTKGNKTSFTLLEPMKYHCVSFWYFLPKPPNSVTLYIQDEPILEGQGVWKRFQWQETSQWDELISAESVTNGEGFVAIDDVLISEDCSQNTRSTERFDCGNQTITIEHVCDFVVDCANGEDERNCGECDFRDGLCGWKPDGALNRGTTAWRRQEIGEVKNSPTTGVYGSRNGYYLLLHSNATRSTRRLGRAIIDSPVIRNTDKLCTLVFWYNYISNGTRVDVDLAMTAGGYTFPVWTLSALSETPEEGVWNEVEVEIGRYRSEISFYFSGILRSPDKSVFAVDEIEYTTCALPAKRDNCTDKEFRCRNGACVMKYERCNYVDDCGDKSDEENCGDHRLSCNFDTSFCDWLPEAPTDETKKTWRLTRPTAFLLQSPTRDHTTGTPDGMFIMVGGLTTTNATVVGPPLDNSTFCAMTFFYAMQGASKPKLTIGYRTTKNGTWRALWRQQRPNEFFHFIGMSLRFPRAAPYQVAFIGEHTVPDKQGYIAIDDVHFWESCQMKTGGLPAAPAPTKPPFTCGQKEFQCGGIRQCISLSKVCDFKQDCPNGADESRCGFCEFTDDLCGLENEDSSARYGWNWTSAEDGKKIQGFPTTDSRSNTQGAYAAYSLLNPEAPKGQMKGLATPELGEIAHSCVVNFFAYIPNKPTAVLMFGVRPRQIFSFRRSTLKILGSVSGTKLGGQWRKMFVKVGNWDAGAKFVYIANTVGVSIDRPEYSMCHPDSQSQGWEAAEKVTCKFSNPSNCGWFPERQATDTAWVLYAGGFRLPAYKWQPIDSDSHKGPYMYAQNFRSDATAAHLVSVKMGPTSNTGRCFTFWYNIWQPNVGHLYLMKRVENVSLSILWRRSAPQGKEWKQGQVQLYSDDPHQLVFEAVLLPSIPGMIAIDDIVLNDTSCSKDKSGGCNFEADSCGWELNNWEYATRNYNPVADHTTQSLTGRYALAKSPGGRMVSPQGWYDATRPKCFRFWFYITGTSDETLNVTRVLKDGQETALWSGSPYKGNSRQWHQASINLPAYTETPTIVFDGATSGGENTVVAVDDISLGDVPCPSPGSCSFEEDMCGWFNNRGRNNLQWYRHRGATVFNTTGVEKDHTLGSAKGYYLLLDAGDLASSQFGSLQSQILSLGSSVCLSLYYAMKKDSGASLIFAFLDKSGTAVGPIKTVTASVPSQWTRLTIARSDLPDMFSVIITGVTARGRSDVIIDDIDIRNGKCQGTMPTTNAPKPATPVHTTTPQVPQRVSTQETTSTEPPTMLTEVVTPEPVSSETPVSVSSETPASPEPRPALVCGHGEFSCRDDSTCIPAALLCDGVNDCPNGLDEKCGSAARCTENEFFCPTGSPSTCMPRSLLCDGHEDCVGGSDESLCRACPHYLCQNGGICGWTPKAPSPTCDCRDGYEGRRCNLLSNTVPEMGNLKSKASASSAGVVTGIIVVLVILVIAAVAAFIVIRRRRNPQNTPVFLDNPSYDASTDETRLFN